MYLYIALMPRFDEEASEVRQTRAIIAAAQSCTPPIRHVAVSTALNPSDSADDVLENDLYQRFKQNKLSVEHAISQAGFTTWAVLRPGYFMSNFLWPLGDMMFPQLVSEGKFVNALGPQTRLPLIDPDDIGAFVVAVFQQPQRFDQKIVNLASESRTTIDIIAALEQASGKPIEAVWMDDDEARKLAKTNPMIMGQILTGELDRLIDYDELKEVGLIPGTFDAFLKREEAWVQKTFHGVREKQFSLFEHANK